MICYVIIMRIDDIRWQKADMKFQIAHKKLTFVVAYLVKSSCQYFLGN